MIEMDSINFDDFVELAEFPHNYISRDGKLVRVNYYPVKIRRSRAGKTSFIDVNKKWYNFKNLVANNPIKKGHKFSFLKELPNYIITRDKEIFRREINLIAKRKIRNKYYGYLFPANGKYTYRSFDDLMRTTFGFDTSILKTLSGDLFQLPEWPGFYVDKDCNVFNEVGKQYSIVYDKNGENGKYALYANGRKVTLYLTTLKDRIARLTGSRIPIKGYEDYSMDFDGNIYGKRGSIIKPICRESDNFCFVIFYELVRKGENKIKHPKGLGRLVAEHLLPNSEGHNHIKYLDGDNFNCHPSNIKWISDEEHSAKRSEIRKKVFTNSLSHAMQNCTCPILLEYYQTRNIAIIENEFGKVREKMKSLYYWKGIEAKLYTDILDRLERNFILKPLLHYVKSICRYYNISNHKINNGATSLEDWKLGNRYTKIRLSVDDLKH